MSESLTLEEVEHIVDRLSTHDKLKLVSYIHKTIPKQDIEELENQEYLARFDAFLSLINKLSVKSNGPVDSVEDIRQIREERMARFS